MFGKKRTWTHTHIMSGRFLFFSNALIVNLYIYYVQGLNIVTASVSLQETPFKVFETKNNTKKIVQLGSTAELECYVKYPSAHLNVSWHYVNGSKILTMNNNTECDDKRFKARLVEENTQHWVFRIRYTTETDVGLYECRLEGDFVASIFVSLAVQKAKAVIKDSNVGGSREVEIGSTLRLSCYLVNAIISPSYIFWYKGDRMINYDLDDGESIREGRLGSELIFPTVNYTHSGNYSCVPSNAEQASLQVKVCAKVRTKC